MARRNSALTNYLESDRSVLPLDYKEFQMGGARSEYCVFCRLALEDYQNMVWKRDPRTRQLEQLFCSACDTCDETISQHVREKTSGVSLSREAIQRIEYYTKFGEFHDDHVHYVVNHRHANKKQFCYFCQQEVYGDLSVVLAPVSEKRFRSGGKIGACEQCQSVLESKNPNPPYIYETCLICKNPYATDNKEAAHRDAIQGVRAFDCPACVEKTVIAREDDLKSVYAAQYRQEFGDRFTAKLGCSECSEPLVYDLYTDFTLLTKSCPDATLAKCVKCSTALENLVSAVVSEDAIIGVQFVFHVANFQIIVKQDTMNSGKWGYETIRTSGTKYTHAFYFHESLTDAFSQALQDIKRHDAASTKNPNK